MSIEDLEGKDLLFFGQSLRYPFVETTIGLSTTEKPATPPKEKEKPGFTPQPHESTLWGSEID